MTTIPTEHDDPINAKILSISEDLVSGYQEDPFALIAKESGVEIDIVLQRIRAMLDAGVIRRVRQTMLATKLAHGALVAWRLPEEKLNDAFDFMANEPGAKLDVAAEMMTTTVVDLSDEEWRILLALKEELKPEEIIRNCWDARAEEAGVSLERFHEVAHVLDSKKVIGRFSTFLEHVKPSDTGKRVTRFNGLFHWAVDKVMEHKAAIDKHLESMGIPVSYTNVFWGGRSEIKPSEISPKVYQEWHEKYRDVESAI